MLAIHIEEICHNTSQYRTQINAQQLLRHLLQYPLRKLIPQPSYNHPSPNSSNKYIGGAYKLSFIKLAGNS